MMTHVYKKTFPTITPERGQASGDAVALPRPDSGNTSLTVEIWSAGPV